MRRRPRALHSASKSKLPALSEPTSATATIINFDQARAKHSRAADARAAARAAVALRKSVRERVAHIRRYVELLDHQAATDGRDGLEWIDLIELPGLEDALRASEARLEFIRLRMSGL
jgi:hypothetical protein